MTTPRTRKKNKNTRAHPQTRASRAGYYLGTIIIAMIALMVSEFFSNSDYHNYDERKVNTTSKSTVEETTDMPSYKITAVRQCRVDDCGELLIEFIRTAQGTLDCAFFEFDLEDVMEAFERAAQRIDVRLFVDGDDRHFTTSFITYENRSAYMHNKFCVDSNRVFTGSMNPTYNDRYRNDNNVIIIEGKAVADIYRDYIREMLEEHDAKANNQSWKSSAQYRFELHGEKNNETNSNETLRICRSRAGNCLEVIYEEIARAKKSVRFMLFTMTDDAVTNLLVAKHVEGLDIRGVMERSQISIHSGYHLLENYIPVMRDCNPRMLHHKVFIIDNETVITGSFNPSNNAQRNNEENMVVIRNRDIAQNYIKEFERVSSCTT